MAKIILSDERLDGITKGNVKGSPWAKFKFLYGQRPGLSRSNVSMLLFFIPVIALIFVLDLLNKRVDGTLPFFNNIGVGFPFAPYASQQGDALLATNMKWFMLGLIPAACIFALAFSGALKVIRNGLISIKVDNESNATTAYSHKRDFIAGMRENALVCVVVFSLWAACVNGVYYLLVAIADINSYLRVAIIIAVCAVGAILVVAGMFTMILSVGYKQKIGKTIKNAFIMTFENIGTNIFSLLLTILPFGLLLFDTYLINLLILMYYSMLGFSITAYIWIYQSTRIENRYPKYKTVNNAE